MTAGYQPDFDIDKTYGEESEGKVAKLLGDPSVECKRKRRPDDVFYVETGQSPRATGSYKPSGINTTKADYWSFEIADTGIVVLVPTARLKAAARSGGTAQERDGDNPTKGRLVSFKQLLSIESQEGACEGCDNTEAAWTAEHRDGRNLCDRCWF